MKATGTQVVILSLLSSVAMGALVKEKDSLAALRGSSRRQLGWFYCPPKTADNNKGGYFYKMQFADGSVAEGYSNTADIPVNAGDLENSPDSSFLMHVSCSDTFATGYSDLGGNNGPLEAEGDPMITKYLILKYAYDKSGECFVRKVCPDMGPTPAPTSSPTASPSKSPTSSPTKSPTTSPSASPTIPRCTSNSDCDGTIEYCAAPAVAGGPRFCEPYSGPGDSCDVEGVVGFCNPAEAVCFAPDNCLMDSSVPTTCVPFSSAGCNSESDCLGTDFCFVDAAAGNVCMEKFPENFCCENDGNCVDGLLCYENAGLEGAMTCQYPPPTPSPTKSPSMSPTASPTKNPTKSPTKSPVASRPVASPIIEAPPATSPVAAPVPPASPVEPRDPTCPYFNDPEPENSVGVYDDSGDKYTCGMPLSHDVTSRNLSNGGYSIKLLDTNTITLDSGAKRTQFFYKVCTAEKACSTTAGRRALNGFDKRAAISHVTIGLEGRCVITDYTYIDLDGSTDLTDFGGSALFAIGLDPTTCASGFKFDNGWDKVAGEGCANGEFCRTLMIEIDGDIPLVDGQSAVKASTGFYLFETEVPNCVAC